jgi:RNA polymerase sigma-70 factor (ECF subfamily)
MFTRRSNVDSLQVPAVLPLTNGSAVFESEAMPHLNALYQTASRLVRDRTEAQDLVQQVYLQAWKAFDRFEPGTNCRAWLFKILINEVHHYRRSWFNTKTVPEGELSLEETLASEPAIPEHLQDEDVLAALDGLHREFREVILLSDGQEFSYREIAEIVGVPPGTVMSRLSRGRRQLRVKLADYAAASGMLRKGQENFNDKV